MRILLVVISALGAVVGLWAFLEGPLRDPHDAIRDFQEGKGRFEDQLTDPLVLAGSRVRPLVLSAVSGREMKLRRYALAYLGCSRYTPAEDTLRHIASDAGEADYFRADALEALWRIDSAEGVALAQSFHSRNDFLGEKAAQIIGSGPSTECRSWFSALTRRHD